MDLSLQAIEEEVARAARRVLAAAKKEAPESIAREELLQARKHLEDAMVVVMRLAYRLDHQEV